MVSIELKDPTPELSLDTTLLRIPEAGRPFSIFQITDMHLCACDERNSNLVGFMKERHVAFGGHVFETAARLVHRANELKADFSVLTGDILDVSTQANLEQGYKVFESFSMPWTYVFGNHEWWLADPQDRTAWWLKFPKQKEKSFEWDTLKLHNVNLVFLDNTNYQINDYQYTMTKQLAETGEPCLLFFHIPVSLNSLRPDTLKIWKDPLLMGDPDWGKESRLRWGNIAEDLPSTKAFLELLRNKSNLRAIFSGHLHFSHSDEYRKNCHQHVTKAGYLGGARVIQVVPDSKSNPQKGL